MADFQAVRSLRLRYICGLSAIALLVTASWMSLQQVVAEQETFNRIINVAGHQGGNAERIALFTLALSVADNEDDFVEHRAQLGRTINTMRRQHAMLVNGDEDAGIRRIMTPMLELIYFDPGSGLDAAVDRFLGHAQTVYATPYGELTQQNASFVFVMQYGPHVLKNLFDAAVTEYEAEGHRAVQRIKDWEFWVWITALCALVIEAVLIFRPLERRVAQALGDLRWKNQELERTIEQMTQARQDLRASEDRFREMAENVPGVMFRLVERKDGQRFYEYVSPSAAEFCGVAPERIRQDWRAMNLHPDDIENFQRSIRAAHESGSEWSFEGRVVAPDGNQRWWKSVSKPVVRDDAQTVYNGVMIDITNEKEMEEELRRLATTDPLTGAFNRRHFMVLADEEVSRATRHGRPISVLMLDIDHFKKINDTYGHAAGDEALKRTVDTVQSQLRGSDVLGRFGGEEFAVLIPETDTEGAMALAERIRCAVECITVVWEGQTFSFTTSVGVATLHGDYDVEEAFNHADQALYEAKSSGRNRVISADAPGLMAASAVNRLPA